MSELEYDHHWAAELTAAGFTVPSDPINLRGVIKQIIAQVGPSSGTFVPLAAASPVTVTAPLVLNGQLVIGAVSNKRLPAGTDIVMNGSLLATNASDKFDKVLWQVTGTLEGGFTGENSSNSIDPAFAFGTDMYLVTGQTVGDVAGLTTIIGAVGEVHLATPNATVTTLIGLEAVANIDPTATNATVSDMASLFVQGQTAALPSGASVTIAYGIQVQSPTVGVSNFAIETDGNAPNRLLGTLQVTGTIQSVGSDPHLLLKADLAELALNSTSDGGSVVLTLGGSSAFYQFNNSAGTNVLTIRNTGQLKSVAGNEATGAGSAALGANSPAVTNTAPYTWEKIMTSDGSQCYFPVWK